MKCPHCGAWTNVLDTRATRRRRECANGHRFATVEVVPSVVNAKDYRAHLRGAALRAKNWVRDRRVADDPRGSTAIARELGLSEARVRQIRARVRQARSAPCAASS